MDYDIHPHSGPVSADLETCPLCGQLLPNGAEGARIRAKLDADERARQRQWEADKQQIAAASRNEARAEAEAAAQQRFTILLNENARLKENMQTTVDEQVNKLVADREAKFNVERALHSSRRRSPSSVASATSAVLSGWAR
jgi:DNA repair exonuclease SbcCD ATPase subunit